MRVKPRPSGKQRRQRQQQQQSCVNTSGTKSNYRTEFGLWFLDDTREEYIIRDPHLQECLLPHHDRRHSEEARAKLVGKRIHVWGSVALPLHRWSFKSVNWAIFVQSEDHKRIIPPRMMNYANSLQEYNSSFPWIEHEIITPVQKLDWKLYGECTHSYRKEDKHFLYNGECTISFDNNASEAEVIADTKKSRKANHQIDWRPEQDAKYWIYLSATQKRILADKV